MTEIHYCTMFNTAMPLLFSVIFLFYVSEYETNAGEVSDVPLYFHKPTPSSNDFYYNPTFHNNLHNNKPKYPQYNHIPVTSFSCQNYPFSGYFADILTGCQVYHRCEDDGRRSSYLCPNQTIFSQKTLVCDWWYNVECSSSSELYHLNYEKFSTPVQVSLPHRSPALHNQGRNAIVSQLESPMRRPADIFDNDYENPQFGAKQPPPFGIKYQTNDHYEPNHGFRSNYENPPFGPKQPPTFGINYPTNGHYEPNRGFQSNYENPPFGAQPFSRVSFRKEGHFRPDHRPVTVYNRPIRPQRLENFHIKPRHINYVPPHRLGSNANRNANVYIVAREGHDSYSALHYGPARVPRSKVKTNVQ